MSLTGVVTASRFMIPPFPPDGIALVSCCCPLRHWQWYGGGGGCSRRSFRRSAYALRLDNAQKLQQLRDRTWRRQRRLLLLVFSAATPTTRYRRSQRPTAQRSVTCNVAGCHFRPLLMHGWDRTLGTVNLCKFDLG